MAGARGRAPHGRIAVRSVYDSLPALYLRGIIRAQRTPTAFFKGGGRREKRVVRGAPKRGTDRRKLPKEGWQCGKNLLKQSHLFSPDCAFAIAKARCSNYAPRRNVLISKGANVIFTLPF